MLHLAFAAGMRVPELVGLQLSQIDRQGASTVRSSRTAIRAALMIRSEPATSRSLAVSG
jgi:site-specific recombinase XerD